MNNQAMSKKNAPETRRKVKAWIAVSIRDGHGTPTQQDIRNRFGLLLRASSGILAEYKKELEPSAD